MKAKLAGLVMTLVMATPSVHAQPVSADEAKTALAALNFKLEFSTPDAPVTVTGPKGTTWSLPAEPSRFDAWFNGPADHTGDDIPELIVIERTTRSGGTVHVIELGSKGPRTVMQENAFITDLNDYANLAPGEPLDSVGMDGLVAVEDPVLPAAEQMAELGYTFNQPEHNKFEILRYDAVVYDAWGMSAIYHGPAYMTESTNPGVLILNATSRSFSDLLLVEMTENGPEVIFSNHGFNPDVAALFHAAIERLEAGERLDNLSNGSFPMNGTSPQIDLRD